MDSLKTTEEYLKRDTISFGSDFIFIHVVSRGGCIVAHYSHTFFYYNSKLLSKQKGIIIYSDLTRKNNSFSYISHGQLSSIINTLNSNMAFNISGSGKEVLPDQQFYTTGMGETEMVLIAHEKQALIKK
jgi:hypothetical protein